MTCLDLYCGGGGAARGLHQAGFRTVGVDLVPSPNYPGPVIVGDATNPPVDPADFDLVWASPPCARYSALRPLRLYKGRNPEPPDLIGPTREWLAAAAKPYVIENVPNAPIRPDVVLTGPAVGLPDIRRKRWFELSWWPDAPTLLPEPTTPRGPVLTITTSLRSPNMFYRRLTQGLPGPLPLAEAKRAMGIDEHDPMTAHEVGLAVAPPMARFIADLALAHLETR